MKIHYTTKVKITFVVTMLVLLVLVVFSYKSTQQLINTARLLSHSSRVISKAEETLKAVVDVETSVRGYIITQDSSYLDPHVEAQKHLPKHLRVLDSLTLNYPKQHQLTQTIVSLISQRLLIAEEVIIAGLNNPEKAKSLIRTGEGKNMSDTIRSTIKKLQAEERSYFQQYNKVTGAYLQQFQYSLVFLVVLIFLVIVALFYQVNKQLKVRYTTEKTLQNTAAEVKDLYDNAPCGYLSVNSSLYLASMNETLLGWLGYSREEIVNKAKFEDLLTPESRQLFLSSFERDFDKYKTDGYVSNLEFDFLKKDGNSLSVVVNSTAKFDSEGNFSSSRTTVFDNTERKMTEAKFKSLLESSPDALVIAKEDGIIHLVNNQCSVLFGYSREELVGQPVEMLLPKGFRSRHVQNRISYCDNPNARPMGIGLDLFALRKDGIEFPVEISLSPLKTAEGLLVTAAVRDVSINKQNLARISQLNQELEAFTYSVSHDLRAPLRSITGYANILVEEYGATFDEESNRITQVIISNAKRMGQLIDDLLDFSRMGRKELSKVTINMTELVAEVVKELRERENGRKMQLNLLPLVQSNGDVSMIRQVWVNLVSNAFKYSNKKELSEIEIGSLPENGSVKYYVKDNGAGFDMKYSDKLFGVFQRLHKSNEFEGTGVGLALVKRIVQRHGGDVWAEGKVQEGAIFYFTIPN